MLLFDIDTRILTLMPLKLDEGEDYDKETNIFDIICPGDILSAQ